MEIISTINEQYVEQGKLTLVRGEYLFIALPLSSVQLWDDQVHYSAHAEKGDCFEVCITREMHNAAAKYAHDSQIIFDGCLKSTVERCFYLLLWQSTKNIGIYYSYSSSFQYLPETVDVFWIQHRNLFKTSLLLEDGHGISLERTLHTLYHYYRY